MFNLVLIKHEPNYERVVDVLSSEDCLNNHESNILGFISKARVSGVQIDHDGRLQVSFIYDGKKHWHVMNIAEFIYYRNCNIFLEQEGFSLEIHAESQPLLAQTA
jgi:hypothetical protein